VYGFSPALIAAGMGHFQLQFAVLPPLIIDALLRILTGRGHATRNGVGLGLLVAAQFFTGEELLADTALTALVMLVVLAAGQPRVTFRTTRKRVRAILAGLGAAVVTAALICGFPLWEQFKGPLATNGSPWRVGNFYNHLYPFVTPSGGMLFHTGASAAAAAAYPEPAPEYVAYLGWPLLGVLLVVAVGFWRDPRVRLAALTCALLELFSLGNARVAFFGVPVPLWLLPWHWLQHVPVLEDVLADRLSILADGAAAAALAFALSRALALPRRTWPRRLTGAFAAAVAVLAVLPIVPRPLAAAGVPPPPPGWQAAFTKLNLPPDAPVLIVPDLRFPLRWQAETGVPGSMIGGGDITEPGPGGHATSYVYTRRATARYLYALWLGSPVGSTTGSPVQQTGPASEPSQAQIRADLAYWRLAAIVAVTVRGSSLARFWTREFGPPTVALGDVLGWREPHLTVTPLRGPAGCCFHGATGRSLGVWTGESSGWRTSTA
jgi:hypothetical protein